MIGGIFRLVIVAGRPSLRPEPREVVASDVAFADRLVGTRPTLFIVDDLGVPDRQVERSGDRLFRPRDPAGDR